MMKRFLFRLTLFLFLVFVVLAIVDALYSYFVARSGQPYVAAWNDIINGDIDADLIAMGNSRALHHIDPFVLDSVLGASSYNLALDGAPINYQIQKYKVFCSHNIIPKVIIQNIDYVSLYYGTGMEKHQLLPFWWDFAVRKEIMPYEPYPFPDKYIPLYRYHGYNLAMLVQHEEHNDTKGFDGVNLRWDGEAFRQIDSITFISDERTEKMLDGFLAETKTEGIKVVFVYTPMYIGATNKLTNPEEMHNVYQRLADRYGIPILDYTYSELCYDTTYFFNALHLNARGADLFSKTLAHDIKKLGLLN